MGMFTFKDDSMPSFNLLEDNDSLTMLALSGRLSNKESSRLRRLKRYWNFYDGYHWEEFSSGDGRPQITANLCRVFTDKLAAFEFRKGFTIKSQNSDLDNIPITAEGKSVSGFLEQVWSDNKKEALCMGMGVMKNVTGDAWIQIVFDEKGTFEDPFDFFPDGRIRLLVLNTSMVFPEYDQHDTTKLIKLSLRYPINGEKAGDRIEYTRIWTSTEKVTQTGDQKPITERNNYGFIPFVRISNFEIPGRGEGISDLEDMIPLNVEFNLKKSDISEIIDYHAAPVTVLFGAQIKELEKGANKIWGGLPKEARVENLSLGDNLVAATGYVNDIGNMMYMLGHIPESSMGLSGGISNTSSVALQYTYMPLIERVDVKRLFSKVGLEELSRMILKVSFDNGLAQKPDSFSNRDIYDLSIDFPDMLPKDELIELQKLQSEINMGIESRAGVLARLNRTDIDKKIKEIDEDSKEHPEFYNMKQELNSGITNGQSAKEEVRKEISGINKK